ncbi:MAG: cadherin-like beta sandwich domain-containing protein [Bacilli bacterium]|nr:cadherin-like beta sandwich domain-containing protein [Bacilli bacterium]
MFVIDMKKGFYVSFFINIGLAILLLLMTILYFTKGTSSKEENLGLQQLSISDADIDFKSDVYAYHVTIDETVDSLDLGYVAYEKDAKIKVKGNENFKEGNNQIVITVTEDSKDDKVYYIIVEKVVIETGEELERDLDLSDDM